MILEKLKYITVEKWFSSGVIWAPGDIFGPHSLSRALLASSGWRPGVLLNTLQ